MAYRAHNYDIGWFKVPYREHWIVLVHGTPIGELFQVQPGHQYYALVYDRTYPTESGCLTSTRLSTLEDFFMGIANGES